MGINFSFKTSIKFNGKEYGSVDEMPNDVRKTYEQIMANIKNPSVTRNAGFSVNFAATPKIVFNGVEYTGVGHMPPEIRRTYESLMAAPGSNRDGLPGVFAGRHPAPPPADRNVPGVRSPLSLGGASRPADSAPRPMGAVIGVLILIIIVLLVLLARKSLS